MAARRPVAVVSDLYVSERFFDLDQGKPLVVRIRSPSDFSINSLPILAADRNSDQMEFSVGTDRKSRAHARISSDSPIYPKTERLDGG